MAETSFHRSRRVVWWNGEKKVSEKHTVTNHKYFIILKKMLHQCSIVFEAWNGLIFFPVCCLSRYSSGLKRIGIQISVKFRMSHRRVDLNAAVFVERWIPEAWNTTSHPFRKMQDHSRDSQLDSYITVPDLLYVSAVESQNTCVLQAENMQCCFIQILNMIHGNFAVTTNIYFPHKFKSMSCYSSSAVGIVIY